MSAWAAAQVALCLDEHLPHGERTDVTLRHGRVDDGGAALRSATSTAQSPYVQACLEDLLLDDTFSKADGAVLHFEFVRPPRAQSRPDGGGL